MPRTNGYWFPAKRYGWGWGFPVTWQGWVVLAVAVVLVGVGVWRVLPAYGELAMLGWIVAVLAALVAVCWATGEPPRWRWGRDS